MGNNKFKFSDMIPNAWFYKLKDLRRKSRNKRYGFHVTKNQITSPTTSQRSSQQSNSHNYFFSIEPNRAGKLFNSPIYTKHSEIPFTDSSKRKTKRKTIYKPSPPTIVISSPMIESFDFQFHSTNNNWTNPNQIQSPEYYVSSIEKSSSESDLHEYASSECDVVNGLASDCSCRVSSSTNDIIIDMNNESFTRKIENLDGFGSFSQMDVSPILTKPVKFDDKIIEAKISREKRSRIPQRKAKTSPIARKSNANASNGIKLRANSPKLASKKVQAYARRSVSSSACKSSNFPEGFAVVKSSVDPQRDFRESMVEMILENNIRASKDLENLLACYLSLNSSEYHDLIIKAFEQIWCDMAQLRL